MDKNQQVEQAVTMNSLWQVQEVTTDGQELPEYTVSTESLLTIWYHRISENWLCEVMNCSIGDTVEDSLAVQLEYPEQNCTVKSIKVTRLS